MTNDELEKAVQFVLDQQAQLTVKVDTLADKFGALTDTVNKLAQAQTKSEARITQLEDSFRILVQLAGSHDERLVSLAEAQIRTNEQLIVTDEKLNTLITIVERYISGRGQNGMS